MPVELTDAEKLARAVLLFHKAAPWMKSDDEIWVALTGSDQVTTKVLCDLARKVRQQEERK